VHVITTTTLAIPGLDDARSVVVLRPRDVSER